MERSRVKGRVFDVQRYSVHDGPGIRTTVFLKGCPLRCKWCHNPEGIAREFHLSYTASRCIACGNCVHACSRGAHVLDSTDGHRLRRELCDVCGDCVDGCYSGALEMVGRDLSVEEVLDAALRDRPFYETSGGGLTLSGGEPLAQIAFSEALLVAAKASGLHCAIETSGYARFDRLARLLPCIDLFIYDVKETDDRRHREYTGVANGLILSNLKRLHDAEARVLVRLPIVPGFNDRPDHFEGVARVTSELPRLVGVEVMPYHRLGTTKRARMGIGPFEELDVAPPKREVVAGWVQTLKEMDVPVVNDF